MPDDRTFTIVGTKLCSHTNSDMSLPEPIPPTQAEREANRLIRQVTTRSYASLPDTSSSDCLNAKQTRQVSRFLAIK